MILSLFLSVNLFSQNYSEKIKTGIVFSENTWQQLHSGDYNYFFIQDWEIFFMNHRLNYTVFNDADLEDYNFEEVDLLILPGVEILTDEALQNILVFLNEGKSVLILGYAGNSTPSMRMRLNNLLEVLGGCTFAEVNRDNQNSISININSLLFPERTLNNQQIFLRNNLPVYFTDNADKNLTGGFLEGNFGDEQTRSAILLGKYGRGRFAWFGFHISQLADGLGNESQGERLIFNTVNYLSGFPLIMINDFPADYRSAVLFVDKIRNQPELKKTINFVSSFKNFKTDFFINPLLINDKEINLTELTEHGNIHLLYDPLDFLDKPAELINKILNNSVYKIKQLTHQHLIGIWNEDTYYNYAKTDELNFDEFDFRINGNKIISAQNNSIGNDTIFFNLMTEISDPGGNFDERKILHAVEKNQVVFFPVSDLLKHGKDFNTGTSEFLLMKLSNNNCWVPYLNELVIWMELKKNIFCSIVETAEKESLEIIIINNNPEAVENIKLRLILNEKYSDAAVSEPLTKFYFDYTTNQFYMKIGSLASYEKKKIIIKKK